MPGHKRPSPHATSAMPQRVSPRCTTYGLGNVGVTAICVGVAVAVGGGAGVLPGVTAIVGDTSASVGVIEGSTIVGDAPAVGETAVSPGVVIGAGVSSGTGDAVVVPGSIVGVASGSAVYMPHNNHPRNNKTTTAMMISMVL